MVKVLVSLDDRLLARLDRLAAERGLSRSALLAEFAARGLGELRGPGTQPEVRAALSALDRLFAEGEGPPEDSTATIRAERDAR
jgi:metal-responsive CopG/Arc/MetJ family transcriptional regulator